MSIIKYNGQNVFSPQPAPLVTRGIDYIYRADGRKLVPVDKYSLVGQITGCQLAEITGFQAVLNAAFNIDFGTLEFVDSDFTGVASGCKINSIEYSQGIVVGIQPYTINLTSYPENFFESLGIIEKKNTWSVNQEENQNLTITHEITAKGANTGPSYNNALDNAKNFVLALTGFNPPTLFPFFIQGFSGSLDTRNETINRLEGTYSIIESYIGKSGSNISEEISVQLTSGGDGIIEVSINGTFKAGKNQSFDTLRTRYSGFDSYAYVTGTYYDYRKVTGLVPLPLSSGLTEDIKENSLVFNISFNDFPTVRYKHIPTVQVTSGIDGIITTSVNGEVQGLGRQNVRYDNAYNFFKTLSIYNTAVQAYNDYVGVGYSYSLNPFPSSSGLGLDRFGGKITYNVSFSDKPLALNCSGIKDFDYSISKDFSIRVLAFGLVPFAQSGGCVQDLNYATRAVLGVNGSVLAHPSVVRAKSAAQQFINNKFRLNYLQGRDNLILDGASLTEQPDKNSANFQYTVSFDEPTPTNPNVDYVFITGLHI